MRRFKNTIKLFAHDDRGATAVEYTIMIAGIALAIIITVYLAGERLAESYADIPDVVTSR
ncbi:MAG: Flp family type IVb pilin [Pseudomonadota bacterium]